MSVYQISRIQHRRGTSGELPTQLAAGEIGITTDTGEIFFGASDHPAVRGRKSYPYENIKVLTELDVQRGIKGDVYYHGALATAICPPGAASVIPLFGAGTIDFGHLEWGLSSQDESIKAMGTLQFISSHGNLPASPTKVFLGPTLNFSNDAWLDDTSTWGLTSESETGANDGYTWLRFFNQSTTTFLLTISGREWTIPSVVGFNA